MTESIKTPFTEMFGIKYPIVAAPMFLVSTVKLVTAVSEAGGLGTFPALNYRPVENYRKALKEIKEKSDKPFGVNIIVQNSNKYRDEQIDISLEEGVPLLITSLGSPGSIIKRAHETGTKVFCDVVGLKHAQKVIDLGADGLIAVGSGAGGHAGTIAQFALIPQLVRNFNVPVLAAGSIVDGAGMAAAFSLGAAGIYLGTRFIASSEAEVPEAYKNAIVNTTPEKIIYTDKVDGFPGNFILTPELEKIGLEKGILELILSKSRKLKKAISLARAGRALLMTKGEKASYKTVFSAGHGAGLIDSVLSSEEIIRKIVEEYGEVKRRLP
jgi:nitronate monooxygenase